ncbi:hypothetical protein H0H92_015802 [Tricholoma furcatifolium]|nr:hypothetical protein H0H92_015802 [Tricholoma furcatifolium]
MAPSDGKRNPRRLLSFDALTRSSSPSIESSHSHTPLSKTSALPQIIDNENTIDDGSQDWTESHGQPSQALSSEPKRKPAPLKFSQSPTPNATVSTSSSRTRWDQLRQHVLPIRAATPPVPAASQGPAPTVPLRNQTPKPSRLARLGFRHVVEHVREADELVRKASQEIEKLCWTIKMAEPQKVKVESHATGSTLHLAFMSNASLSSTAASNVHPPHVRKKHELQRPQSIQSLTTAIRTVPSVKPLCQIVLHHATPSGEKKLFLTALPHESLVLSTLLTPFLSTEVGKQVEEERMVAIEAFEVTTRTWAPANEGMGVERYLWCCKAAFVPPSTMRTRILSILWGLVIPTENNYVISTPECFQTLVQGLFFLLPTLRPLSNSPLAQEEVPLLMDVITKVREGCCGELETHFLQEEYDAIPSAADDKNFIRESILLESLSRCLEDCTNDSRIWLFQNTVEQYWTNRPGKTTFTPLLSAIHARTLNSISRALLSILSVPLDQAACLKRAQCISQILMEKLIPDIDALGDIVKPDTRVNVVNAVLELICMDRAKEPTRWGLSLVNQWFRESSVWKSSIDTTLQNFILRGDWSNIIFKLASLTRLLPDEIRKPLVVFIVPLLYDRLVESPPSFPYIPLTNLLDTIARLYPQVFYKPLFSCAASSKEFTVVNHLCIIVIVSKFLPDFWIRDAEMVSVALMSDGGRKAPETDRKSWIKPRLGQAVVLLELIACIQAARHEKEVSSHADNALIETVKFVTALEARLAILLEARRDEAFDTIAQTVSSTKRPSGTPWLARVIDWYLDLYTDDGIGPDPEEEEKGTIGQIQGLYAAAQDGVRSASQRRSTTMLLSKPEKPPPPGSAISTNSADLVALFVKKEHLITSIAKGFAGKAMKLLVTMSTLLNATDYRRLAPCLWDLLSGAEDASLIAAVRVLELLLPIQPDKKL